MNKKICELEENALLFVLLSSCEGNTECKYDLQRDEEASDTPKTGCHLLIRPEFSPAD